MDGGSGPSDRMMPMVIFASSILSISLAACILPRLLANNKLVRKYFPLANVFTGGIQLATIIADLLPEMCIKGEEHNTNDIYPFITAGASFILLLAIDTLLLHPSDEEHKHHHESELKTIETHDGCENHEGCESHKGCEDHEGCAEHQHSHKSFGTCNTGAIAKSETKRKALILLFAISIHSFPEGLSINPSKVQIARTVGLILHKVLESFAIGAALHDSVFSLTSKVTLMCLYSLLTPIAIVFRSMEWLRSIGSIEQWANALCLGALLFVVFFEIIGHSFHGGSGKVQKIAGITAGYTLGCIAIVLAHSNHCHDHHH